MPFLISISVFSGFGSSSDWVLCIIALRDLTAYLCLCYSCVNKLIIAIMKYYIVSSVLPVFMTYEVRELITLSLFYFKEY